MKKCTKCKYDKNLSEFYSNKSKKDGKATECKDCRKEQDKKYREENKETRKNYQIKYWKENSAELYEAKKEYISNNKEAHLKRQHTWYEKNKDSIKIRISQYKKDHPEQYQMYNNRRLALKKTTIVELFTIQDIVSMYGNKCFYCNDKFDEIDHYIPLSKGGSHTLDNIRPSCKPCNLTKSNKLPDEFIKYKGISK